PKALLHDHLYGGLRPATVVELADAVGHDLPATDPQMLGEWFVAAADSGSLERYLQTFAHTVAVMQTEDSLFRVARECALDLAGAEAGYPPTRHLDAFEYLQRENFHFTIHAGEAFGLPSIWQAIQWCGADRLGHGVRIVDDITRGVDGAPAVLGRLAAYVRDK